MFVVPERASAALLVSGGQSLLPGPQHDSDSSSRSQPVVSKEWHSVWGETLAFRV